MDYIVSMVGEDEGFGLTITTLLSQLGVKCAFPLSLCTRLLPVAPSPRNLISWDSLILTTAKTFTLSHLLTTQVTGQVTGQARFESTPSQATPAVYSEGRFSMTPGLCHGKGMER
jgi:hypothetical protein